MKLSEVPLSKGPQAMHEAVLLGRALLGYDPGLLEQKILLDEAWQEAQLPRRGVTVHVSYQQAGKVTSDHYIVADTIGGGQHHHSKPQGKGPIAELVVVVGATPAQDRFMRLHQHLEEQYQEAQAVEKAGGPRMHPTALRRRQFVHNVARALARRAPDAPYPFLQELSRQLETELFPRSRPTSASRLKSGAQELEHIAVTARDDGNLDIWAAAALLLTARLPLTVAAAIPTKHDEQLTRYFMFAVLEMRVSPWQALYGPPHKALREGFQDPLGRVADALLETANHHRDNALEGPKDRDYFSQQLFLGAPYAFAAMTVYRFLVEEQADAADGWLGKATTAEELMIRFSDGLAHQWLDFDDARLQEERREILRAQRRGDKLTVELLLREGELGLRRPRSARGLLLGEEPWPKFQEVPNSER